MINITLTRIDSNGVPSGTYSGHAETVNRNCEGWTTVQGSPGGDWWDSELSEWKVKPAQPDEYHVFDYTTKQWIDPRTAETEWPLVRKKREILLAESDWTQLPDVPVKTKEAWATYRQALRDITEQPDPFNIVWPTPPVT